MSYAAGSFVATLCIFYVTSGQYTFNIDQFD